MTTVKRTALGKNLSALLGNVAPKEDSISKQTLFIDVIKPGQYQPRRVFSPEAIEELASSIKQQGLLQPIIVRALNSGNYEILAGERRWRACKVLGLKEIPVIIKSVTDEEALVIALVENLQREDLKVLEAAKAMDQLLKMRFLTHQQVADLLGKSRSTISNLLRLLNLEPKVQEYLDANQLEMGHARALLMLDKSLQIEAALLVIAKNLTVRATEKLVAQLKKDPAATYPKNIEKLPVITGIEQILVEKLKTKVEIKAAKSGKGKLVIHYDNNARLEEIVACFRP
ncbi:MAG: chromosome partitioning protein ParB [Gammaproteobacteria bacterium RIFCSPHIGHO2_12_FULL_41_15]|nr:MAG: chromosome partitioning protein ParB [Gammaproteobacteria bacterium RIFCSPHIGHO2_12_FULL_41_15]